MARMVATKAALSVRIDALSDADTKSAEDAPIAGIEHRVKLESRLRALEQGMGIQSVRRSTVGSSMNQTNGKPSMNGNGATYNPAADVLIPSQPSGSKSGADDSMMQTDGDASLLKKSKKEKKRKREAGAEFAAEAADAEKAAPAEDVSCIASLLRISVTRLLIAYAPIPYSLTRLSESGGRRKPNLLKPLKHLKRKQVPKWEMLR